MLEKIKAFGRTLKADAAVVGSAIKETKTADVISEKANTVYTTEIHFSIVGAVDGVKEKKAELSAKMAERKALKEQEKEDREAIRSMTDKLRGLIPEVEITQDNNGDVHISAAEYDGEGFESHCLNCNAMLGWVETKPEKVQFCGRCNGTDDCTTCNDAQACWDDPERECVHAKQHDGDYLLNVE